MYLTRQIRLSANRCAILLTLCIASPTLVAATLTWDPAMDGGVTGGPGIWDNTTANWWDGGSNVAWTNNSDAVFGGTGGIVTIASGATITVNNVTLNPGVGTYTLMAQTDNEGISVTPGAIWDLNDNEFEFVGDQANDTRLTMAAVGTLTVTGTGAFDAGERPNGANWAASGSTLDFQAGILRGAVQNVGQFAQINMAEGATFFHERNTPQTYTNDWLLGGSVTFENRFVREFTLSGVVSGAGSLIASDLNGRFLGLDNPSNTFTGGLVVDSSTSRTEVQNAAGDGAFGAVPVGFDPDYITLRNGGELKMNGVTIHANRGITLDDGGIIINTGNANNYGGSITGTGGLQIGRDAGADANTFVLNSSTSDYAGGTRIYQGRLQLGTDNALPNTGVLTIGGKGQSKLWMIGFDQEIGGLRSAGTNTRIIENSSGSDSVLTINVAAGEDYAYASNWDDRTGGSTSGNISIVKTGDGTQRLTKSGPVSNFNGTVTVNDGTLIVNNDGFSGVTGSWTINSGGTLGGNGEIGAVIQVIGGTIAPGTSPETLTVGGLELDGASALDYELNGMDTTAGSGVNDLTVVNGDLTLDGTLNVSELASFAAATNGTWTLFRYTSNLTDNGLQLGTAPELPVGHFFQIDTSTPGEVNLVVSSIPEPASALLMLGSLMLGAVRTLGKWGT